MTQNRRLRSVAIGLALLPLAMAIGAGTAKADDTIRWKTIIGVAQAGNVVAGIAGGGQPWSTLGGDVSVNMSTGKLRFSVRGLVLAGGNAIGTPGPVNQVEGTLVCDPAGAKILHNSAAVPLSPEGDASFNGSIGVLEAVCFSANPAFLIRNVTPPVAAVPAWIANGAVLDRDAE
jgi:hypothetical protein